jgi:hypothetical protein
LKVYRKVVVKDEHRRKEESDHDTRAPNHSLAEHRKRQHCFFTNVPLPDQKRNQSGTPAAEQANDCSTVPRVLFTAPLQSHEDHDGKRSKQSEATQVKLRKDVSGGGFRVAGFEIVGNVD